MSPRTQTCCFVYNRHKKIVQIKKKNLKINKSKQTFKNLKEKEPTMWWCVWNRFTKQSSHYIIQSVCFIYKRHQPIIKRTIKTKKKLCLFFSLVDNVARKWGVGGGGRAQNADWPVFIQRNFYKVAGKWIWTSGEYCCELN